MAQSPRSLLDAREQVNSRHPCAQGHKPETHQQAVSAIPGDRDPEVGAILETAQAIEQSQ